ncbi:EMILIN-2 [Callorhinchus milii]|uniref:EMILIN-2 n=1 Tax=Callorhinchus milii TaxID=7868 RepID=UPI001C3F5661|nr:EMILIN-2 [Callorhinchus milii]
MGTCSRPGAMSRRKVGTALLIWSLILISLTPTDGEPALSSSRYNLFSSPRSAPRTSANRATGRNKNLCAYVVHKNVTCSVVDSTESYTKAEYQPCPWDQMNCPPVMVRYTRPTYKVAYKVVTELEWRCCPGFKGEDCRAGHSTQTAVYPSSSTAPRQRNLRPKDRTDSQEQESSSTEGQGQKVQQLEYEVQRLNQVLEKLQASVTGMSDTLRHDVQEDASKMFVSLLSNLRLPGSAIGVEAVHVPGSQDREEAFYPFKMGEMMSTITEVKDTLKSKSDMLDDLHGMVTGHDGQLKQLMEAAQAPISTSSPFPSGDLYQAYIDSKFEALRDEMMMGIDMKFADLKNSCEYKLMSLKEQCEENVSNCEKVEELLDEKEIALRKEIHDLRTLIQESPSKSSCCASINTLRQQVSNMDRRVHRIADANRVLNARLDNEVKRFTADTLEDLFGERLEEIDSRINVTEKNAEEHCFYIEDTLKERITTEIDNVKELMDRKLRLLANNELVPASNSSLPRAVASEVPQSFQNERTYNDWIKNGMEHLESKLQKIENLCLTGCSLPTNELETIRSDMEICRNDYEDLLVKTEANSILLKSLNSTVHEGLRKAQKNEEDLEVMEGKLSSLTNTVEQSVKMRLHALDKRTQALANVNSTLKKNENELLGRIYELQEMVKNLEFRLKQNSSQLAGVKEQMEQLSSKIANDMTKCKDSTQGIQREVSGVDNRLVHIENMCSKLDGISGSLQRIKDGLNRHVSSLWNCVRQMNETVRSNSKDIVVLKNSVHQFHSQVAKAAASIEDELKVQPLPVERGHAGSPSHVKPPRLPTMTGIHNGVFQEVGYAGPPGSMVPGNNGKPHGTNGKQLKGRLMRTSTSGQPHGTNGESVMYMKGDAGAPGNMPLGNPRITERSASRRKHVSFSVGLTEKPFPGNVGVIVFNKVLVNDGGHYNTKTGIFTAPFAGQYLITAVLAPQREERVEAFLSVSNEGIIHMDTSGYQVEVLEFHKPFMGQQICGGIGTFNLILNLKAGDEVSVVLIDGKLVDTHDMYSTFSGTLLYETPSRS